VAAKFVAPPYLFRRLLAARFRLEKEEDKDVNDTDVSLSCDHCTVHAPLTLSKKVSADMKKLNAKFGRLHGYSSLANLIAFLSLAFHGLWIGNYGIST
jgi:hypothetical protein